MLRYHSIVARLLAVLVIAAVDDDVRTAVVVAVLGFLGAVAEARSAIPCPAEYTGEEKVSMKIKVRT